MVPLFVPLHLLMIERFCNIFLFAEPDSLARFIPVSSIEKIEILQIDYKS